MKQQATVQLVDPRQITKNPDNPRLIFRKDELEALEHSIREQGILVPLSVYREGGKFVLLDGERRWRCSLKLGLHKVPAYVQEKPDRATNIMMMFAIHNARKDWDPLPTALKLRELETVLTEAQGAIPTESDLAAAASLSVGEVRRYRRILSLPADITRQLIKELEKPRQDQALTVDHVLEAMAGARQLEKRQVLDADDASALVRTIIAKFRARTLNSTVEPRKLARIARAVQREEVDPSAVRRELTRFANKEEATIDDVYKRLIEDVDYRHGTLTLVSRANERISSMLERGIQADASFTGELKRLIALARALLRD